MQQKSGKHPSYNSRPVPIFQLSANVAKFNGQRKDELYGAANEKLVYLKILSLLGSFKVDFVFSRTQPLSLKTSTVPNLMYSFTFLST
jgi:hypothetical protein